MTVVQNVQCGWLILDLEASCKKKKKMFFFYPFMAIIGSLKKKEKKTSLQPNSCFTSAEEQDKEADLPADVYMENPLNVHAAA